MKESARSIVDPTNKIVCNNIKENRSSLIRSEMVLLRGKRVKEK